MHINAGPEIGVASTKVSLKNAKTDLSWSLLLCVGLHQSVCRHGDVCPGDVGGSSEHAATETGDYRGSRETAR